MKREVIVNQVVGDTNGRPVLADIHFADTSSAPFVVFCHGFKGFKDWGSYPHLADYFSEKGVHFLRFNFSHNGGTLAQPIDFPDLKAFGENTFSKELSDLRQVIEYVYEHHLDRMSNQGIRLMAHSRGAATAIIHSSIDNRVSHLATWAGVSTIKARLETYPQEAWKKTGVHLVRNGRTKQDMPLYYSLYTDYLENQSRFDVERRCGELSIPHLVIHANDDLVVPPSEAKALERWTPDSYRFCLETGGHTFGAIHPAMNADLPEQLRIAADETIKFFNR